mgnify:FL=1
MRQNFDRVCASDSVAGALAGSKPRYEILDGLRGVAAIFVIWFHFGEAFATSAVDQMMNHGYLAVDFFFILSGFVIGYAYDDRWRKGMTASKFMLRRVIRLHPMVILGLLLGVAAYLIQGSVTWDGTPMPLSALLMSLLLGLFLVPILPGAWCDIRGNNEMFPLNGPTWSLFMEYIGSILYAVWLHRLSGRGLKAVVGASAVGLAVVGLGNFSGSYNVGVGWTLMDYGFVGGFVRMMFAFSVGVLMSRNFKPIKVRGSFWLCSAILAAVFATPYVGAGSNGEPSVANACFDQVCTFLVFPLTVYIGASGVTTDAASTRVCDLLGRLSYPVYVSHYPIMYLFYSWIWANGYTFAKVWPVCVGLFLVILLLAWVYLKFYDEPVRRYLSQKLLRR